MAPCVPGRKMVQVSVKSPQLRDIRTSLGDLYHSVPIAQPAIPLGDSLFH